MVAAFASWHGAHEVARASLIGNPAIVAHAAFETYSVLTRIQPPERAHPGDVRLFIEETFGDRWLGLATTALRLSLGRLEQLGISAGQTYDGLIAMTAASHGATLLTLDRRAQRTYALVGADVELVA